MSFAMGAVSRAACLLPALVLVALVSFDSPAQGQSLWQRAKENDGVDGRKSIFLRKKKERPPLLKNDIVMIQVLEEASASNDARLESRRELEIELLIDKFIRFSGLDLKPDVNPQPEITGEATRELKGRGKTDRNESVRLRIAARIVQVLPNGNLVLEAKKKKQINDETTTVTLSGEIRSADVDADYVVRSDRIADMKLAYSGEGPVSANVVWTWVTWVVDMIWPF